MYRVGISTDFVNVFLGYSFQYRGINEFWSREYILIFGGQHGIYAI